ncbi:sensor histidine kinase [Undibacterium sp. FT147W]|uniref:Sensor histidine kinase n=1 Tax=Undibacterium rivi TaxID=2828729 RepID=A0ABS5H0W0_9BURK|nr:ATP-binding protein [Undibacterium rivi]MBR7792330.1 sensor histidine kinase [Undibacterium rivi]
MRYTEHEDVSSWLEELDCLEKNRACSSPKFIKPFHFATVAHILRKNKAAEVNVAEKIASYANTMNLWGAIGLESPHGPIHRAPAGRYIPLFLLEDENSVDTVSSSVVEMFRPVCSDDVTLNAVDTMLRELIGNCFAHAASEDGLYGLICGQVWASGKKAQIALVDSGIGIRGSLRQNEELFDTLIKSNACELATQYGVTSKPGKGHSGYGLAIARKLLEQNNGVLYVRSGDETFILSGRNATSLKNQIPWNGTMLIIEWNIDVPMDIAEVYRGFPQIKGYSDDDFDF